MFRKITKGLEQNLSIVFGRIPYNNVKSIKIRSVISRKKLIVRFQFSKFGCCKPTTLPKKLHPVFFFWGGEEFGEFSQNIHKEQLLLNISERIK